MRKNRLAMALAMAFPLAAPNALLLTGAAHAQTPPPSAGAPSPDAPSRSLGIVTVNSGQPTSLPTQIPTTMEGITREQIEQTINASDSEDVLKYFPSLLVRKRYIGDYNHAILSSRASGTGNSARSAVYADGILLSNYLGNGVGGLSFPPRWNMVTPAEIERVDVMYGPFSAAYAYMGVSKYFTTDLRVRYQLTRQWAAAFGIDNLNNDHYWNFHPYPQRSYMAELKFDL